ncbi:hypothetical protein J4727_08920 [Providencia rettgeri]|uniref:Uncharacterized protein n=1 Tax=Providencia rettgeri TaxID=587 RepID=A0A939NH38_PRORE|nr:hypothetical protein [Providencia rettgeri]
MPRENERVFSEHLVNNRQRTALYIENTNSEGTSWNTANGNDVVIGKNHRRMPFKYYQVKSILQGEIKTIHFYSR